MDAAPALPESQVFRRGYTRRGEPTLVWSDTVCLECDAWASADALAERVFALAGGDLLRKACGDIEGPRCIWFYVGV